MRLLEKESLDLTILMPCLNEEKAVVFCIQEAQAFLQAHQLNGEILIADNASTDHSAALARKHGARVVTAPRRGYGNALRVGLSHSRGRVIILGDCDTTYDFRHLEGFYTPLAKGHCDVVIGNRYAGTQTPGAMPWSHRWGVKMLSLCGRLRFHTDVYDFHCGLRGLTRAALAQLDLHTGGMEFATEFIAQAAQHQLTIRQTPTALRRCQYDRKPKLRTVRDGLRHLVYLTKGGRL